jgi:MYXO-CTERM domain-containing protein
MNSTDARAWRRTRPRRGLSTAFFGAAVVVLSCSADRGSVPDSPAAAIRIADLRARFPRPALSATAAARFEAAAGSDATTHLHAVLPAEARRGVARAASVALPVHAGGEVKLEDETSHLAVAFALENVQNTPIEVAGGIALYRSALDGADVVHRVLAEGTEDFVIFESRPAREELRYSVDVSRVPGLRLVSNTLEFLDETGTPLLRVAPPYVVDARNERHEAKLAVTGCAYDTSPAGPWRRKVTGPAAERCTVHVLWGGAISYPAMVDPFWSATGSMTIPRSAHTASVLGSGRVLIAGGNTKSAELFDPAGSGTFAATGSMALDHGGPSLEEQGTASVLLSGDVLIAGGASATAEIYVASTGMFVPTGSLATIRTAYTATVLPSGKVLIAGGNRASPLASAELFDPAANAGAGAFTATGSMTIPRRAHTATLLASGKVLIGGGSGGVPGIAEIFDPSGNSGQGTFTATAASLNRGRDYGTATRLPSGRVLLAGGEEAATSAEIFDPADESFTPTANLAMGRLYHTASLLPSGKVLVVGGRRVASVGETLAEAELFDPTANAGLGSFAPASSMASARTFHAAAVLPSGEVLVTGGEGAPPFATLASAERYAPSQAVGAPCTASEQCLSGFCVAGVCCDAACNEGACDRCDLPGKVGTCTTDTATAVCQAPPPCATAVTTLAGSLPSVSASSEGQGASCRMCSARAGSARWPVAWLTVAVGLALFRRRRKVSSRS